MMVVQELHQRDHLACACCCKKILKKVSPNAIFITSNKAHFHLSECVNKINFCDWSDINPNVFHEKSLYSDRVTVWSAVGEFGVWGL